MSELDEALAGLAASRPPDLPASFQQKVWREIRRRQEGSVPFWKVWVEQLLPALLQPQPILASLLLSVVVGVSAAYASGGGAGSRAGMNMEVFSHRSALVIIGAWE